jgi:hypothetical protein
MKTPLASKKEAFRLWFEYLQVARKTADPAVKAQLIASSLYYAPWEMDQAGKFDAWWKDHAHLFEEKFLVREMTAGEKPRDPDALVVEIPLTQSATDILKKLRPIIQSAFDRQERQQRKSKKKATAQYRLTDGAEPKLDAIREMLSVYRDVALKNPKLKGIKLLHAIHQYYRSRKNKMWAKIPMSLDVARPQDEERALRNMRRYIQRTEKIIFNVAKGNFPGNY